MTADAGKPGSLSSSPDIHASSPILRPLPLPATASGRLWLAGLPHTDDGHLERFLFETAEHGVKHVLILTEDHEIHDFAPAYAQLLSSRCLPFSVTRLPISDYGIPSDASAFRLAARRTAGALRLGERVLTHCRGGIGRTGLMSQAILIELGVSADQAGQQVADAGSRCETAEQCAFLREAYAVAED